MPDPILSVDLHEPNSGLTDTAVWKLVLSTVIDDGERHSVTERFERDVTPQDMAGLIAIMTEYSALGANRSADTDDQRNARDAVLVRLGKTLHDFIQGSGSILSQARDRLDDPGTLILSIGVRNGLAYLPWELLHDGSEFLILDQRCRHIPIRRVRERHEAPEPANRWLNITFMAASPEKVSPVLDYEAEEHKALKAAGSDYSRIWLQVEESGNLAELNRNLELDHEQDACDLLHLSGHGKIVNTGNESQPVYLAESPVGDPEMIDAQKFGHDLKTKPPILFASFCHSAQAILNSSGRGTGQPRQPVLADFGKPLTERLCDIRFPAVLGWDSPVRDLEATDAGAALFASLAKGDTLADALSATWAASRNAKARDWHLLRLYVNGDPRRALVTRIGTPARKKFTARPVEHVYFGRKTNKVASREEFVGRRRLIQNCLKDFKNPEPGIAGVLLNGQGGRGKSSLAARLCDRLKEQFFPAVVFGRIDRPALIEAIVKGLETVQQRLDGEQAGIIEDLTRELRNEKRDLKPLLQELLEFLDNSGRQAPLFVFDDFEQNFVTPEDNARIQPEAANVLKVLRETIPDTRARILVTSRFALPTPLNTFLSQHMVYPFGILERAKHLRRLLATPEANQLEIRYRDDIAKDPTGKNQTDLVILVNNVIDLAGGNPRLFQQLFGLIRDPAIDPARFVEDIRRKRDDTFGQKPTDDSLKARFEEIIEKFTENLVLEKLIGKLDRQAENPVYEGGVITGPQRQLLSAMLLLHLPVPRLVIVSLAGALTPPLTGPQFDQALERLNDLGLVDKYPVVSGEPYYAAARILAPNWILPDSDKTTEVSDPDYISGIILIPPSGAVASYLIEQAFDRLYAAWFGNRSERSLQRFMELNRLAKLCNRTQEQGETAEYVMKELIFDHRAEEAWRFVSVPVRILSESEGAEATKPAINQENSDNSKRSFRSRVIDPAYAKNAAVLITVMRALEKLADGKAADEAALLAYQAIEPWKANGKTTIIESRIDAPRPDDRVIIEVLFYHAGRLGSRGDIKEAERIYRKELLPYLEATGAKLEAAVTLGKLADAEFLRGNIDKAKSIYENDVLPSFKTICDKRESAFNYRKPIKIDLIPANLNTYCRTSTDATLPNFNATIYKREMSWTSDRFVDIQMMHGIIGESRCIHNNDAIHAFKSVGENRSAAVAWGRLADIEMLHGNIDEAIRICKEIQMPVYEAIGEKRELAISMRRLADIDMMLGNIEESRRIYNEILLIFQAIGDNREVAITWGRLADIDISHGNIDQARRICLEIQMPIYEAIIDKISTAITWGRIAVIEMKRGNIEEASRILKVEELPTYETIDDIRSIAISFCQLAEIEMKRGNIEEALRIYKHDVLPIFEDIGDLSSLIISRTNLAMVLLAKRKAGSDEEAISLLMWSYQQSLSRGLAVTKEIEVILRQIYGQNFNSSAPPAGPE